MAELFSSKNVKAVKDGPHTGSEGWNRANTGVPGNHYTA
jgi:hypothetical protein